MGSQLNPRPLRMAVLNADTPMPQTKARFRSYAGVFTDLFRRAVAPQPLEDVVDITSYDVVVPDGSEAFATYPDLAAVDVVLITGSKHNSFEHTPWIEDLVAFAGRVLATTAPEAPPGTHPVRLLGICFGHQIVARALGSPVDRNPRGWEASVTDVALTPAGKAFFGQDTLKLHQMHRDAVLATPPGAANLATTAVCANQGFLLTGRVVTVQGHPEFTGIIVRELLEARRTILPEPIYAQGIDCVDDKHDGEAIARAFLRFCRE